MSNKEILERFPEVMWDRWSGTLDNFTIFGWVDRENDKYIAYVEDSIDRHATKIKEKVI